MLSCFKARQAERFCAPNSRKISFRRVHIALDSVCIHRIRIMAHLHGVGDDARGLEDTLRNVPARDGINLQRPRKERVAGWAAMRERLFNAKEQNGRPGMWITGRCR